MRYVVIIIIVPVSVERDVAYRDLLATEENETGPLPINLANRVSSVRHPHDNVISEDEYGCASMSYIWNELIIFFCMHAGIYRYHANTRKLGKHCWDTPKVTSDIHEKYIKDT